MCGFVRAAIHDIVQAEQAVPCIAVLGVPDPVAPQLASCNRVRRILQRASQDDSDATGSHGRRVKYVSVNSVNWSKLRIALLLNLSAVLQFDPDLPNPVTSVLSFASASDRVRKSLRYSLPVSRIGLKLERVK